MPTEKGQIQIERVVNEHYSVFSGLDSCYVLELMQHIPGKETMQPDVEKIWFAYHRRLKHFIRSRVTDPSGTEDILQEVFIKVQTRIGTLRDPEKVESWIFQIARNTIIDHHRTNKILDEVPEDLPVNEKTPEKIDCKTGYTSIKAIIDTLPQPYAEALFLTEFEGLTAKELAQRLNLSLAGAKSRLQRARRMLKENLRQCCRIEYDNHGGITDYQCSRHFLSWFKKMT